MISGKKSLLDHPLFEIMIHLKWAKTKVLFNIMVGMQLMQLFLILMFSMSNFSGQFESSAMRTVFNWHLLNVTNIAFFIFGITMIPQLLYKIIINKRRCKSYRIRNDLSVYAEVDIVLRTVSSTCAGLVSLYLLSRGATAVFIFLSSLNVQMVVFKYPGFGDSYQMTVKVGQHIQIHLIFYKNG